MTPAARLAATIEILAGFLEAPAPLEERLRKWFRGHRFAGSKDRRAIREQVYRAVRRLAELKFLVDSEDSRLMMAVYLERFEQYDPPDILEVFAATPYGPGSLSEDELTRLQSIRENERAHPLSVRANFPDWLESNFQNVFGDEIEQELAAFHERAPVGIRVNGLKASRRETLDQLRTQGFNVSESKISPVGLRAKQSASLETTDLFQEGKIEIQDEGSQTAAILVAAEPGHICVDYCAGAGGKSLALAASMKDKGQLYCFDISGTRIQPLEERKKRAGVESVRCFVLGTSSADRALSNIIGAADRVLVDAPCSGSGTWRRAPDAKWLLTESNLKHYRSLQAEVLQNAAPLTKVGGRLVYVTCSILPEENDEQVSQFLNGDDRFDVIDWQKTWQEKLPQVPFNKVRKLNRGVLMTPYRTDTDGFYVAILERVRHH